jgi:hypothetical protein
MHGCLITDTHYIHTEATDPNFCGLYIQQICKSWGQFADTKISVVHSDRPDLTYLKSKSLQIFACRPWHEWLSARDHLGLHFDIRCLICQHKSMLVTQREWPQSDEQSHKSGCQTSSKSWESWKWRIQVLKTWQWLIQVLRNRIPNLLVAFPEFSWGSYLSLRTQSRRVSRQEPAWALSVWIELKSFNSHLKISVVHCQVLSSSSLNPFECRKPKTGCRASSKSFKTWNDLWKNQTSSKSWETWKWLQTTIRRHPSLESLKRLIQVFWDLKWLIQVLIHLKVTSNNNKTSSKSWGLKKTYPSLLRLEMTHPSLDTLENDLNKNQTSSKPQETWNDSSNLHTYRS